MRVHCRQLGPAGSSMARGFTLVEVIAATAIMGVLLVGIVMAKSRHTRQWAAAQRKLQAIEATESFLSSHWTDRAKFPRESEGELEGGDQLRWRTRQVPSDGAEQLKAAVVRLEVWDEREPTSLEPLVSVDLLLEQAHSAAHGAQ